MKKTKRVLTLVIGLILCLTAVFAACSKLVVVTITPKTASVKVGSTVTLTVKVSNGAAVEWSSSDENVATVVNGVVTGVRVGKAVITAKCGEASDTCDVTVSTKYAYTDDGRNYTSHSFLAATPSNWNEMDYENANDTNIIGYIGSSFFSYDYPLIDESLGKFNADGTINVDNLNFDQYVVQYGAATALEDVTGQYAEDWDLSEKQVADGGYVWKITLRDDLCWDDGTPIKAEDFVYSMEEQLNYEFLPFRASTYWSENGMKIRNAQNYYYNGRTIQVDATDGEGVGAGDYTGWDSAEADGGLSKELADSLVFSLKDGFVGLFCAENLSEYGYGSYITNYGIAWTILALYGVCFEDELEAFTEVLEAMEGMSLTEIAADEAKSDALQTMIEWWCTDPDEEFGFFTKPYTYPALSFDQVGIFADGDYDIIVVLDKPQAWLKADGSIDFSVTNCSLPLVKKDLYESCKKAPALGASNWTTTYCTTLETTASWGPYKLTSFQTGKQFTLERNTKWYAYNLEEYRDQYLTDKIVVDVIETDEAARMAFWAGQIDDIDLNALGNQASLYQNSDYAIFTPSGDGYAYGIQIFSDLSVLNKNGQNNSILAITDFRWALSLSFDRTTFNGDQLIGMELGLGLIGTDYCYDAETGNSYRESEQAKAALLRTYGFTLNEAGRWTDGTRVYADIDDATDAMTGYNLTLAKEKLQLAITELTNNAEKYNYDPSKDIIIRLGKFNDKAERRQQLLQANIDKLVEGSSLEGKVKVTIVETDSSKSADEFRDGKFEFYCVAAIGGAILYPFNSVGSYLGLGDVTYHAYFDVSKDKLTMTMPAGDYEGAGETLSLFVDDWFNSLNGNTNEERCSYNWGSADKCPTDVRLEILAMLEEYALKHYYSIQVAYDSSAYLHSAKYHNISDTYNLFMGLGGGRYIRYDYTDEEWDAFVQSKNGDLSEFYKTSGVN